MKSSAGGSIMLWGWAIGYLYGRRGCVYYWVFGLDQEEGSFASLVLPCIGYWFGYLQEEEGSQVPAIMTRIVNLEEFVEAYFKGILNLILSWWPNYQKIQGDF